jgi:uridine kinase
MSQEEICNLLEARLMQERIIVIGGYPCCGKTTISNILKNRVGNVQIIEAEHWLYPLSVRVEQNTSGSNPLSYNINAALDDISSLLKGGNYQLPIYKHSIGGHEGFKSIETDANTKIILDGTLFTVSNFVSLTSASFLLKPENYNLWLEHSIIRDVDERSYARQNALEHNERKFLDMSDVEVLSLPSQKVYCLHEDEFTYRLTNET